MKGVIVSSRRLCVRLAIDVADGALGATQVGDGDQVITTLVDGEATTFGRTRCLIRALVGNTNGDNNTDLIDASQVKFMNGVSLVSPPANARFDVNLDGTIDLIDVAVARHHNGKSVTCPEE